VNIKRMADTLRGTLVLPGETFSINGIVGERTYAKGYVDAPGIAGSGELKNSPGGGVSQVATTTFNAMYYAGLKDVEHHPHSYYFSRYPSVIEATVAWPNLDLKFRNDSPYGVLVDTAYTNTSVTVSMWSTKRYTIETVYGPRTNPTAPKTIHLKGPDCIATDGIPGFQQEAWRVFKQNGTEVKRERFVWRYDAEPHFICDPAP
jgi:vancomycin resistance protein YoaR